MKPSTLLPLAVLPLARPARAGTKRARPHATTSLRGFIEASPPTPRPSPHPTTRDWAGYEYPTATPTAYPTYGHETYVPTPAHSSYLPTATTASPSHGAGRQIQSQGGEARTERGDARCAQHQQFLQLDLYTDYYSCETSWRLERLPDGPGTDATVEESVLIDEHEGYYYDTKYAGAEARCLDPGRYRFTIYDAFGDGLASPGYYALALDGEMLAGSSGFGWEETTLFTVGDDSTAATMEGVEEPSPREDGPKPSTIVADHTALESNAEGGDAQPSSVLVASLATDLERERPSQVVALDGYDVPTPTEEVAVWTELASDDFLDGYGLFHPASDEYVTYYPRVKDRNGVVRLQHGDATASVASDPIAFDTTALSREVKVVFSFYANGLEASDGFCLDYAFDDDSSYPRWNTARCWHAASDFANGIWHDRVEATFDVRRGAEDAGGVLVRLRCKADSLHDDVLIDKVAVLGRVEGAVSKDSMR